MQQKSYLFLVSLLFLVISLIHLMRIAYGWEAVIGGVSIPLWPSYVAVAISGYLASIGFRLSR